MATFLVHFEQSGEGCDYTIGCGHAVHLMDAPSLEALEKEIESAYADPDYNGDLPISCEGGLGGITVYELASAQVELSLDKLDAIRAAAERADDDARQQAKERAEYERLQRKFGK